MKKQHLIQIFGFITLATGLATISWAAGELYRYKGANGEVVIDDYIPPEFIPKGYTILSSTGMIIETVEPAMTDEEKAQMSAQKRKELELEEARKKQEQQDAWLLERFSDAGDAVRARDRQLGTLETLIVVAQGNIKKLKKDESTELGYAAQAERSGNQVGQDVLDNLKSIRDQIKAAEHQIEVQRAEQDAIKAEYQAMITRLEEIEKEREQAKQRKAQNTTQKAK
jgi:DNA repair exonuclease SbcCD ATPase subunit